MWPALMDQATACRYLTFTRHQFRALIASGTIPTAIVPLPGISRWSRRSLDEAIERLEQRELQIDHEREKTETRRAIANYVPPALRRRMASAK